MYKFLRNILIGASLTFLFVATGCTDDLGMGESSQPGTLNVRLVTGTGDFDTRAGDSQSPDMLSPATEEERRINDLRLLAFPKEGGELINVSLTPAPTAAEMADEQYKNYVIEDVKPGKYRIYVIANQPECAGVKTEEELKNIILEYSETELPEAGNLPMVYEPFEDTEISVGGTTVTAGLQFTCVKVRYNLLFDKENDAKTAATFGDAGLLVSSVKGERLTKSTPMVLGGPMSSLDSGDETNAFAATLAPGRYFKEWIEDRNASGEEDVIAVTGAEAPASYADKWVYQGTLYLPERYMSDDKGQSSLVFEALTVDKSHGPQPDGTIGSQLPTGSKNTYRIPLGHSSGDNQPRQFPRGTYYEIIGHLQTTEFTEYQTEVHVKDWIPVAMADFCHTTLAVDKTRAEVGSLTYDSICYSTNARGVTMGCDEQLDGKPIIVQYNNDTERSVISFRINPEIPIGAFKEGSDYPPHGETKVWIQANNLRKYLDVEYDVTPMFVVKPHDVIINWLENEPSSQTYTKTFTYETNLGGIKFIDHGSLPFTLTSGQSAIRIDCADPSAAVGTFTVTATRNPVNETVHDFTVGPQISGYEDKNCGIKVTVKPPVGDYKIYFRAINDNQGGHDGGWDQVTFNTPLAEGGSNNWADGWSNHHNIYVYTQIGETVGGAIPEYYVWRFLGEWPGTAMDQSSFPGWYLKTISKDAEAVNTEGAGNNVNNYSKKKIKPGETLLMFNANTSAGQSTVRHRCTHHLDPGLQLFDYEDREGWILYDPLIQMPYYTVFDSRPEIRNVTYTVYSTKRPVRWYRNYGKADKDNNKNIYGEFTVGANISCETGQDTSGKTWYRTTGLVFKSPEGQYEKYVTIVFDDGSTAILFNGANYIADAYNARGSYDNSTKVWSKNIPNFVASPKKTIYYKNSWNWNGTIKAHCWVSNSSNENNGGWPGANMTSVGNNWWKIEVDNKFDRVIFNDGNGNQTHSDGFVLTNSVSYFNHDGTTSDRP